jgi:hypothetical protein
VRATLFGDIVGVANIVKSVQTLLLLMSLGDVDFIAFLPAAIAVVCRAHVYAIIFDLLDSRFGLIFRLLELYILLGLADEEGGGSGMYTLRVFGDSTRCHNSVDPD